MMTSCESDLATDAAGETEFEAIQNVQDAIDCWLEAAQEEHRPVPTPSYHPRRVAG